MNEQTILNHIHSRGVTIIRTLNHALLLLEAIPFQTKEQAKGQNVISGFGLTQI